MERAIYRLVVSDSQGQFVTRDFESLDEIRSQYRQIGLDNCSTHKELRSLPMFRGLIGPLKEGAVIRYESPEVFEKMTQDWFRPMPIRSGRRE
ncbi:MAG: hypothetical protein E7028_03845 [Planctomycetaceae bacterium]|nr:hypothetical protein [Planctomycetaceae bacterium]MBQ2820026.1 hypothetical protein [Thermoguttaceae bacterium]